MLQVEGMASTHENKIALSHKFVIRSSKIWSVDITTIFLLIQSIGHVPIEKAAN